MEATVIGKVKSGSGKAFEVKWNQSNRDVYVSWAGLTHIGKASSANEAMNKSKRGHIVDDSPLKSYFVISNEAKLSEESLFLSELRDCSA